MRSPNENYARELMELFTLGANHGYTEQDIREQARALTGWRGVRRPADGTYDFSYVPRLHDGGVKTLALRRTATGARTYLTPRVAPGGDRSISFRLYPGRYELWCTIADHRARGMRATLTVTK